ncbi:MAG TPA: trypsin-like peptidase domain-containing protein [Planctomycetota bacterium]|nr:trypsin-like peptidase domain-containing protein [Planctomycetota bacterium]
MAAPLALAAVLALQAPKSAPPWSEIVARTAPSVVSVSSRVRYAVGRDELGPFEGSGFVVDAKRGLVATNRHVAGEGIVLDLQVRFHEGTSAPARRIYADPLHDFAFLQIDPKSLPQGCGALRLADRAPAVGEPMRMIGNNGGLASTVLDGSISNLAAVWEEDPGVPYLQTNVASAGGSSGSPVIDAQGAVIGMQTARDDRTSYALPVEYLRDALECLQADRTPTRGTLGLRLRSIDRDEAIAAGGIDAEHASASFAIVEGVVPDSPAAGRVLPGDVLLGVERAAGGDLRAIERCVDASIGKPVTAQVARGGKVSSVALTVADLSKDVVGRLALFAGAAFHDVVYEVRSRTDLPRQGAMVACVAMGSAAEAAELRRDDLVLSVAGRPIADVESLWAAVASSKEGDRLVIVARRPSSFDSATRTITLVVDKRWDPCQLLARSDSGWKEAPPAARDGGR